MVALVILLVGQAMAVMDGSILVVAAPSLRADLHASGAELQLVVAMYTMAFAALVVTGARLGDILGRSRAFGLGLATFTAASLIGGLAPTSSVLIGARALQGAAAALMTPQVLSIIQTTFAGERRARAIGAYSMILAVGVAVGQIVGGLLVTAHLLSDAWRPALLLKAPSGSRRSRERTANSRSYANGRTTTFLNRASSWTPRASGRPPVVLACCGRRTSVSDSEVAPSPARVKLAPSGRPVAGPVGPSLTRSGPGALLPSGRLGPTLPDKLAVGAAWTDVNGRVRRAAGLSAAESGGARRRAGAARRRRDRRRSDAPGSG